MAATITRLVDSDHRGLIAGDDGVGIVLRDCASATRCAHERPVRYGR
jgi:hypothetical protein